jgi:hypothetical protein
MAKYKIGDKVKIGEDLKGGNEYRVYCAIGMEIYKGKIATITKITESGNYFIDLDKGFWIWSDDMFENGILTGQELNNKISELEKQIAELKEQLKKKPDDKMPVGERWKPKENEKYYYIDYGYSDDTLGNDIDVSDNTFDEVDNRLVESGNCYPTREKAEFEAQREKYTRLFRQYVEQHSESFNWNNKNQAKYSLYYDHDCKQILISQALTFQQMGSIYASSVEVLKEAIDFVGEDNVKKYILECE